MQELADPKHDRVVKSMPAPPHRPLTAYGLFLPNNRVDWKLLRDHLKREGRVGTAELIQMLDVASWIVRNEPNVVKLSDPITIVGDIHGQFYDFLKLLEVGGDPQNTRYLFLGDYVDRGSFSIECLLLLLALKINFSNNIILLRGNHECRQLTSYFNFRAECIHKYNQEIYDRVMNFFDVLPLCCVLNNKFFCVHGGISPELRSIEDINKFDRFREIPRSGVFCDLMWADPVENAEGRCEGGFANNDARGCSYYFGFELAKKFLQVNRFISIIRAHEAQIEGYKMHKWNQKSPFPTVITIFSAPNYCDVYNNKGAVIKFSNNSMNIQQYNYTPHPYLLPNFMDVFHWSIPFVAEKVSEILYFLLAPDQRFPQSYRTALEMNDKIKFLEAMMNIQKQQIRENTSLVQMQGMCPDDKLIEKGVSSNLRMFTRANWDKNQQRMAFETGRSLDSKNQKRPDQ